MAVGWGEAASQWQAIGAARRRRAYPTTLATKLPVVRTTPKIIALRAPYRRFLEARCLGPKDLATEQAWSATVNGKNSLLLAACIGVGALAGRLYGWQGSLTRLSRRH